MRVVGGLAVRALCPESFPARARDGQDLDLVARSKQAKQLRQALEAEGYEPDASFNAVHGARQLRFTCSDEGSPSIDVLLDRIVMSHELDLRDRLERLPLTIDATDLLLSKLQIHELNAKDLHDIVLLLAAVPVEDGDPPGSLGLDRVTELLGSDWGWWRTATENLERVRGEGSAVAELPASTPHDPAEQAGRLLEGVERAPKSVGWRLRARIGERKRWYELPEEVEEA